MKTEFSEDDVRKMMDQAFPGMPKTWSRGVHVFTSISYDSDEYRVWFFDFWGSPSKAQGIIKRVELGFVVKAILGSTKMKTFYFNKDLEKSTYAKIRY